MSTLIAYLHKAQKSGNLHLRVRQPPPQNDALKADLHRVGSPAQWDQSTWEWDYPLTVAAVVALQRVADQRGLSIEWSPDLKVFAEEQKKIEDYEKSVRLAIEKIITTNEPLPGYVTNTIDGTKPPLRHQQIGYHWGIRVTGLLLAWDPGTGKTREGTDISRGWYDLRAVRPMEQIWLPEQGRWGVRGGVLVVCPSQMIRPWRDEMKQWQGMTGLELVGGRQKKLERAGTIAHAHIINYESLHIVEGNEYDGCIFDEHHRLSNNSGQTQKALALAQNARRRLGLTGTPITNNLESVFYQSLIIDGGRALGASKTAFLEKYFEPDHDRSGPGGPKYSPKEGAVERVSEAISRFTYFLKKEDAIDLPPKLHTPILLDMTPEQADYYQKVKKEALVYIQDSEVTVEQAAGRMMKLRQICQGFILDDMSKPREFSGAKLNALIDTLLNRIPGRKVVIWGVFTHEINRLCQLLQKHGIGYVRLDGQVKSKKERDACLNYWNNDPRITVFVGQIQLGVGLTLHANECTVPCYDCIYLGIDYSYVNWVQSQDRIHRIGQKYSCNYQYLLTEGGIDHKIYKALLAKADTANAVYKTGKEFFRSLLTDDTPGLAALN